MCYNEVKEIEEYRAEGCSSCTETAIESLEFAMDRCLSSPIPFTYNLDADLRDISRYARYGSSQARDPGSQPLFCMPPCFDWHLAGMVRWSDRAEIWERVE